MPIVLVLPIYLVSYLCRARAWQTLLEKEISLPRTFYVMNVGYLLNNTLPFRMGEIGRVFLLGKDLKYLRVLSSLIMERAFDLILAASLLIGTLPFVLNVTDANLGMIGGLVLGVSVIGFLLLFTLSRNQPWLEGLTHKIFQKRPTLDQWVNKRMDSFFSGLSSLQNPGSFLMVFGWMLASWLLSVVYQFGLLRSVVPQANLLWAGFSLSVMALGVALPSSPAYVGIYEGVVIASLAFFNVSPADALAYAIISHGLNILTTGIFGAIGLGREGTNIIGVYRDLRTNFSSAELKETEDR